MVALEPEKHLNAALLLTGCETFGQVLPFPELSLGIYRIELTLT